MAAAVLHGGTARRPSLDSKTVINAAIVVSILIHFAIGWYFVRGLIGDIRTELDDSTVIIVEPVPLPKTPPPPPPPPEVAHDKATPPKSPPRKPIYMPPEGSTVEPSPLPPAEPVPEPVAAGPAAPVTPPAAPSPTRKVTPAYPSRAIEREVEGSATVQILVGAGGAVTAVEVVDETPRGYGFGKAAVSAVSRWEFATAQPGYYQVTVRFALAD